MNWELAGLQCLQSELEMTAVLSTEKMNKVLCLNSFYAPLDSFLM